MSFRTSSRSSPVRELLAACETLAREAPACEALESRQMLSSVVVPMGVVTTGRFAVVADFNGDGFNDIASSGQVGALNSYASIKYGNGAGVFTQGPSLETVPPLVFNGVPLLAGDFDGNGAIDIIAGNNRLYLNTTGGVFTTPLTINLPGTASEFRAVDFDLDGSFEVLATDPTGGIKFFKFVGATFTDIYTLSNSVGSTVVDVGTIDAVAGTDVLTLNSAGEFVPHLRRLDSNYEAGPARAGGTAAGALGFADGDGLADLYYVAATPDGSRLFIARGDGSGGFATAVNTGIAANDIILTNDLDLDGRSEIVLARAGTGTDYSFYSGGPSQPDAGSAQLLLRGSDAGVLTYLAAANLEGDSRRDLLVGAGPSNPELSPTGGQRWTAANAPAATAGIELPSSPVVPGQVFTITARGVTFAESDSEQQRVQFTIDVNADGIAQETEPTVLATRTEGGTWAATTTLTDRFASAGTFKVIATMIGVNGRGTTESTGRVAIWSRVYYAEGWRNDATVNEYVPLVNPNDVAVDYAIYARYEVGERDQLIASGTLAPNSRGGITVTERLRPDIALVRSNQGYALEVQSSREIGAFFSHYDNLGTGEQQSTATGEAMTNISGLRFGFADLSTSRFDYLLFYNPYGTDTSVTVTFQTDAGTPIPVTFVLGGFRRGGLSLRDLPQLPANSLISAVVDSNTAVLACVSSYTPSVGEGSTAVGQMLSPAAAILPVNVALGSFELGGANTARIIAFNPQAVAVSITFTFSFDNNATTQTQTLLLGAGRQVTITPPTAAGAGFVTASAQAARQIVVQGTAANGARADSTASAASNFSADSWAFADAFLNRPLAGTSFLEELSIFNPGVDSSDITVRYIFSNGTQTSRQFTLAAGGARVLSLHEETLVLDHAVDTWFSVVVTGTRRTVANLTHWDLLQGGGFSSMGTPIGAVAAL